MQQQLAQLEQQKLALQQQQALALQAEQQRTALQLSPTEGSAEVRHEMDDEDFATLEALAAPSEDDDESTGKVAPLKVKFRDQLAKLKTGSSARAVKRTIPPSSA